MQPGVEALDQGREDERHGDDDAPRRGALALGEQLGDADLPRVAAALRARPDVAGRHSELARAEPEAVAGAVQRGLDRLAAPPAGEVVVLAPHLGAGPEEQSLDR